MGIVRARDDSCNNAGRQREPARPTDVLTPGALALQTPPLADCARYDALREPTHAAS